MKINKKYMREDLIHVNAFAGQGKARTDITRDRCHGISSYQHIHQVLR